MKKVEKVETKRKTSAAERAAEVANTFEWLITAFMLAFVFRAFAMEAFRIPTGSMADTLKGAHFRLRCPQCGYEYDRGFDPQEYRPQPPEDVIPPGRIPVTPNRCPSCGYAPLSLAESAANGDRILVLKCIYQFQEPKRWDVVVFKNPLAPSINYIKRLVARPGETVEIIDGDVYIDGQIARKPPKVQEELWMPVYDNDYQPIKPKEPLFNGHIWQNPFTISGSKWSADESNPTIFHLVSDPNQINTITYDTSIGNDFKASYAYDDIRRMERMPYCSDLMARFYVVPGKPQGKIGVALTKYETQYKGLVDLSGKMAISKIEKGNETVLNSTTFNAKATDKALLVKFATVDHQLILTFDKQRLYYDLGRGPNDAGPRQAQIQPKLTIFGAGSMTVSHLAVFRDIHYTGSKFLNGENAGRAIEGNPFKLAKDEFFVLGDNSPNSEDARWWPSRGIGNNGQFYREGVVPRDYLVGKALFVYWPSGFEFPWPEDLKNTLLQTSRQNRLSAALYWIVSFKWIPNVGQMRFVYGGTSSKNDN